MNKEIHGELKKEFQLERMILFSDAVFAIAITLLVIEMKIPEIPGEVISEKALANSLSHLIPKFIGFLISFMIIGLYWTVHHRLFGYVINYNQRLLWLNLLFLMAVALMPFSTAFYSEYVFMLLKSPVIIYASNICFLGIMNFVLWKYVSKPERKLTEGLSQPVARYFSLRAIAIPMIFFTMAITYLFIPRFAIIIPMLIPVVMKIIFNPMKKKLILAKEIKL
ncbi:MAG: TMEM175 family protein [Ferruginibacter sp.]